MNIEEAFRIIGNLADGFDPSSGEPLSRESVFHRPEVVRALFVAVRIMEGASGKERRKRALPEHAGKPWSNEEQTELIAAFDRGVDLAELASKHGRTMFAVRSRLIRLGKIDETDDFAYRSIGAKAA